MITKAISQETIPFSSTKEALEKSLNSIDTQISRTSEINICHEDAILLLGNISKAYENKFIPFHTAARNIHFIHTSQ